MATLSFAARLRLKIKRRLTAQDLEAQKQELAAKRYAGITSYNDMLLHLRTTHQDAIKNCDRAELAIFFVKVDSLRAKLQLAHNKELPFFNMKPNASLWEEYLVVRYGSVAQASNHSLWNVLEEFNVRLEDKLEGKDEVALLALNALRCAWRYYQPLNLGPYVHL